MNNYMENLGLIWTRLGRKAIDKPGAWGYMLTMEQIFKDSLKRGHQSIAVFDDDYSVKKHSRFFQIDRTNRARLGCVYLGASQWAWDGADVEAEEEVLSSNKRNEWHLE